MNTKGHTPKLATHSEVVTVSPVSIMTIDTRPTSSNRPSGTNGTRTDKTADEDATRTARPKRATPKEPGRKTATQSPCQLSRCHPSGSLLELCTRRSLRYLNRNARKKISRSAPLEEHDRRAEPRRETQSARVASTSSKPAALKARASTVEADDVSRCDTISRPLARSRA